jgi:NTP pyrophosphatase (non-canonical NTP hydrolase)
MASTTAGTVTSLSRSFMALSLRKADGVYVIPLYDSIYLPLFLAVVTYFVEKGSTTRASLAPTRYGYVIQHPMGGESSWRNPMAHLSDHPTLKDLQHYIDEVCKERGWVKDTYAEKFLLFMEEVGELAKAMRKEHGLYEEKAKQRRIELEEEFADVLSYLLDLANLYHVDLERAFREKERINEGRKWDG